MLRTKNCILCFVAMIITTTVFGQQDATITCRLWKTNSFCQLPDSINLPKVYYFASATSTDISCHSLDTMKDITSVWVTCNEKTTTKLNMTSNFKNISLIHNNSNDTIHPLAFLRKQRFINLNEPQYDYFTFATADHYFSFSSGQQYDLFILFKNAKVGDKLIIDNFFETEIQK